MGEAKRSDDDWRRLLTPDQYKVTRRKGTERRYSGEYNSCTTSGTYRCVCCDSCLFLSDDKFDSGSGWPSFTEPADPQNVGERPDNGLVFRRTEVVCATCDAHLGHVFRDGPQPTGLRYCINSVALKLDSGDHKEAAANA